MNTYDNIFHTLITILKVKHTDTFTNIFFEEHPHKNNLYGLSAMLKEYNIDNVGLNITDKENTILQLDKPFIAYCGNEFVIVSNSTNNKAEYLWKGKKILMDLKTFCEQWSGIALLPETNSNSIEPKYFKNVLHELFIKIRSTLLTISLLTLVALQFLNNDFFGKIENILLVIINFFGAYTCLLLTKKQSKIKSSLSDKICSLFLKNDCNNVLESEASKIFGLISLSEIGLGYFISNILILLFFNHLTSIMVIANLFSLPLIIWSIWYQKFKVKQWCTLCLTVQAVLLSIFIIEISFNLIKTPGFLITDITSAFFIYASPFLVINWLVEHYTSSNTISQIKHELYSLKSNEEVFIAQLQKSNYYNVNISDSKIIFGNINSKILITVITNPHCNPCANMHLRIIDLIRKSNNKYCIQYIFSSFNDSLNESNKFLVAAYLKNNHIDSENIISEWYNIGRHNKNSMFKRYNYNLEDSDVSQEFESHSNWLKASNIKSTPTILINGFELPANYRIEDLISMDIDIK